MSASTASSEDRHEEARILVLLTTRYPFNDHEAVLHPEVGVLAERFHRVFVLPSQRGDRARSLPANVTLKELPWFDGWSRRAKLRAAASRDGLRVLLATLRRPSNWRPYLFNWRFYLDLLATNVLKSRVLRAFVQDEGLEGAVFYDYWFENSTLALALLRRSKIIDTAVSRAHNFDVYDEDWETGRVPFGEFKARWLDRIFPVSWHGADHLKQRLGVREGKITVSHLGVVAQQPTTVSGSRIPLVVSCAWMHPRKRIHLIPQVLATLGEPIRWVHFGDGSERASVEAAAADLPDEVEWELRGRVENRDVLEFYRSHRVDILLSLSVSEGVPVAMMEALSFGIPIVATDIRGVADVVTEKTGVLLSPEAGTGEIAAALADALDSDRFEPAEVVSFFRANFEAGRNYGKFADLLLAAKERR